MNIPLKRVGRDTYAHETAAQMARSQARLDIIRHFLDIIFSLIKLPYYLSPFNESNADNRDGPSALSLTSESLCL